MQLVDTLADILASCSGTTSATSAGCVTLLSKAVNAAGAAPVDTASAAINIAHSPTANIASLYGLATQNTPFGPSLPAVPNDFTLGVNFTGGGLNGAYAAAIDAEGNALSLIHI